MKTLMELILILTLAIITHQKNLKDICNNTLFSASNPRNMGMELINDQLKDQFNQSSIFILDNRIYEEMFIMNSFGNYYVVKTDLENLNSKNFDLNFVSQKSKEISDEYNLIFNKESCYSYKTIQDEIFFFSEIQNLPIVFLNFTLENTAKKDQKEIFLQFFDKIAFGIKIPFESENPLQLLNTDPIHWFFKHNENGIVYANTNYRNSGTNHKFKMAKDFFRDILDKVVNYDWKNVVLNENGENKEFLGEIFEENNNIFAHPAFLEYMSKFDLII